MAEFQSIFTGQEVDNALSKLRNWIAVDGTYPTVTISGVTYAVIWKSIPVSGTACYGIGLHPTTGRPYQIYYNGSSYSATAFDLDTKNTAGSTNSTSKLFLVGAGSQVSDTQTYSNSNVYTQGGTLYLTRTQDLSGTANNKPALIVGGTDTSAHLEFDSDEIHAKANGTTVANLYLNNDGGTVYLAAANGSSQRAYASAGALYSEGAKVLTAHPTISTTSGTSSSTLSHGGTFTALSSVTKDSNGHITNMTTTTYTLPSDNDTKNTAGSTNSASKLFLVGASSQAANPQTYSNSSVYTQSGKLYSNNTEVSVVGHTHTSSEVGAAAAHHLYHTWDNNTNYYDSYEGGNMFRIVTENMYADCFRFQASTVSNLEYYDGSSWVSWNFDLSNLFDGNARTGVSIPYANRKFRFQLTANGGWPTTALFMLQGTWFSDGGWPNGHKSSIIIETRASTSDAWSQKASFDLSGVEGMAGHTLSSLHTGNTLYRITIEIAPWTNTSNKCPLQRLCLFSNYNGGALEPFSYTGTGNITTSKSVSAASFTENGTTLSNKYQAKDADLTAIAGISDSSTGFLKKTAANTWSLGSPVTSVATGAGLTGGTITTTGTIKAKLVDETANTANSSRSTSTNGGLYAVEVDKSGNLAVRVPWTDHTYSTTDFAAASHTHFKLVTEGDNRNTATTPNDYNNKFIFRGLKTNSSFGSPSTDTYSYVFGLRGWSDSSGGKSHELAFNDSGIYHRDGSTTSWGSWTKLAKTSDIGNGTITIKQTGKTDQTFTVNQSGNTTITLNDTDTKVTAVGNHYTPSGGSALTPTSSGTATRGSTIVMTGVTKDAAGHITGVTGYTLPASDNSHNSHIVYSGKKSDGTTDISSGTASSGNITLGDSGATAGSYGNSSNQEPGYGSTFNVPYITVNAKGIVTSISNKTVKIPVSDNTNTATAADNILDGSNSGTQITYAPYTSQQSKLSFDTSSSMPTRTDRLNLNGILYSTGLYANSLSFPTYYNGGLQGTPYIASYYDDDTGNIVARISGADEIWCHGSIYVISDDGFRTTNDSGIVSKLYSSTNDNCTIIYSYSPSDGYTPIKAECSSFSITNPINSWTLTFPTTTGKVLATNGSVGSSTAPVYVNSNGVVTQGSTYAGGTKVTLNGTNKGASTASFYAPTSAISTTTSKRYLLGSSSTTSMETTNTNSYCYMTSNSIYAQYFYGTSDRRLKENIKDLDLNCLDLINNINLREFSWKQDEEHKPTIGAIAQELKQVLPEKYVHEFIGGKETDDEYLSINDSKLVYLLIGAIQEQQKEIEQLKKEVKDKIV